MHAIYVAGHCANIDTSLRMRLDSTTMRGTLDKILTQFSTKTPKFYIISSPFYTLNDIALANADCGLLKPLICLRISRLHHLYKVLSIVSDRLTLKSFLYGTSCYTEVVNFTLFDNIVAL